MNHLFYIRVLKKVAKVAKSATFATFASFSRSRGKKNIILYIYIYMGLEKVAKGAKVAARIKSRKLRYLRKSNKTGLMLTIADERYRG